ncbi:dTDP-4-dehydrorhamnose reductase [Agromyces sp. NPDC055520]
MSVLITGASGMLGRELREVFMDRGVTPLDRQALDITDFEAVRRTVAGHELVVNAAAYTRVDEAETHEAAAHAVNAVGAGNIARASALEGAKIVHISTDFVFDGKASTPYAESAAHNPLSAYGRTKAAGEDLVLAELPDGASIVRTAWLYGRHGANFATTMLRLARERETWSVVDDQIGQPTWAGDLAVQIRTLVDSGSPSGIYHGTNSGQTTKFDFARAVLTEAGLDPERITPTTSAAFPLPAVRPAYSVLGHDAWRRIGMEPMRDWRSALHASGIALD